MLSVVDGSVVEDGAELPVTEVVDGDGDEVDGDGVPVPCDGVLDELGVEPDGEPVPLPSPRYGGPAGKSAERGCTGEDVDGVAAASGRSTSRSVGRVTAPGTSSVPVPPGTEE